MTTRPVGDATTLPLLERVTRQALEEDYAHVARRRAAQGHPPEERPRVGRAAVVATVVFGLLVATAAVQTSRNASTDETSRSTLLGRVEDGRERLTSLQRQIADVRTENADLTSDLERLTSAEAAAAVELEQLRLTTGYGAARGPGVRIVVADSPDGDAEGRVRTADLRQLVTGLWEAGAEAVSVNGLRLTTRSAIVTSGGAINVNTRSLTPPYVVEALGDTRTLQVDLARTSYGSAFLTVAELVGLQVNIDNVASLTLPAAAAPVLRHAERLVPGADRNTPSPSEEVQP